MESGANEKAKRNCVVSLLRSRKGPADTVFRMLPKLLRNPPAMVSE